MKLTRRHAAVIFAAATLGVLALFTVLNVRLLKAPLWELSEGETDFSGFMDQVRDAYPAGITGKNYFINLNGLCARLMGRRVYNEVVLLNNSMLVSARGKKDMVQRGEYLAELSSYLNENGISFLYVQAPDKNDLSEQLFPEGVKSYSNENVDDLLAILEENNVSTLDLRPGLAATPEQIEAYFYRTDHHWNATGALAALPMITREIQELFPERSFDFSYAGAEKWEKHTLKEWFLGSLGKRVGTLFGGTDDLIWYTPKFETELSCAIPGIRQFNKGDFVKSNIQQRYIEERDYFRYSAYSVYIGGSSPLVRFRNANAPNDLRLMIIKDSYALPVNCYLSTMFREIDVVDPRYLTQCTVAEYADIFRPELVLMLTYPGTMGNGAYTEGLTTEAAAARREVLWAERPVVGLRDMEIGAADEAGQMDQIAASPILERGKRYILRFGDVEFTRGNAEGLLVTLYDSDAEEYIVSNIFDIEYCRDHNGFEWVFDIPERDGDNLRLSACAVPPDSVEGVEAILRGIALSVLEAREIIE